MFYCLTKYVDINSYILQALLQAFDIHMFVHDCWTSFGNILLN